MRTNNSIAAIAAISLLAAAIHAVERDAGMPLIGHLAKLACFAAQRVFTIFDPTGEVRALPKSADGSSFEQVPLYDSPIIIADKRALALTATNKPR